MFTIIITAIGDMTFRVTPGYNVAPGAVDLQWRHIFKVSVYSSFKVNVFVGSCHTLYSRV